jgi:hypothetical protein
MVPPPLLVVLAVLVFALFSLWGFARGEKGRSFRRWFLLFGLISLVEAGYLAVRLL